MRRCSHEACDTISWIKESYGSNVVLNGLDFQIEKGEIFALLGVNGAGKTTALECMEGLRRYDSGTVMVDGKMGIQLQSSSLPAHIKPMEAVKLFAKWNQTEIDDAMLNGLGIKEMEKKQYIQLSTGQKRRLHLALALIGNPDIIFLDESTAGLDLEGRLSPHKQIPQTNPKSQISRKNNRFGKPRYGGSGNLMRPHCHFE